MKSKLLFLLLSIPAATFAADYGIEAAAVDSLGIPEEFATWRIFESTDSIHTVKGSVTTDDGRISTTLPRIGEYRIVVVGMSRRPEERRFQISDENPTARLGNIVLHPASTELSEITVTAQRPLVIKEIDRIAYDVTADEESKTVQLTDILRKVPLVSIEADGTIKVNGSSDFRIYKNGRPNNAFTNNAKEIFKAIPASSIKKIEVITDPGAREDAEGVGAILNIVTNQSSNLKGVTGTISLWGNTKNLTPTPNIYLTTQINKVTLSANGGYWNSNRKETETFSTNDGIYRSTGNRLYSESIEYGTSNGGHGGIEASYEPDTLNLFTAELSFFAQNWKSHINGSTALSDPAGNTLYSFDEMRLSPYKRLFIDGAINYQHSTKLKGETITLSYRISTNNTKEQNGQTYSNMVNPQFGYSGIESDVRQDFAEHTAQIDWSRPYGNKHVLDLGMKFIQRNNDSKNTRTYIGTGETYDDFAHHTSIGAVYADYRIKLGHFTARAGMRYEYSHLNARYRSGDKRKWGKSLNDLAPNVSLNWNINDANTLKISYNRRIYRPGISYLDPTVRETPLVTTQGNPDLGSSSRNTFNLNYSLIKQHFNLDFTTGAHISNNQLMSNIEVRDQHTYYRYENANHYQSVFFSTYARWSPGNKTTLMLNLYASWERYHSPVYDLTKCGWSVNPYVNITQKLPWKLSLRGYAGFWSGNSSLYSYSDPLAKNIWYGMNLQRSFLKDDRLTVSISANNLFGPDKNLYRSHSINTDLDNVTDFSYSHNKYASLRIAYRFGSLSASVKKTATSISNDDLQGGNGKSGK